MHTAGLARQQQAERPWIPPGTPPARCPLVEVEYWREMAATLAHLHTQVPLLALRPCADTDTGMSLSLFVRLPLTVLWSVVVRDFARHAPETHAWGWQEGVHARYSPEADECLHCLLPLWSLDCVQFSEPALVAVADAVAASNPRLHEHFTTAAGVVKRLHSEATWNSGCLHPCLAPNPL